MEKGQKVKLRNGNDAEIVYESNFGKFLVVEDTGDELPEVHWHNANGSFYADCENDLDIVN
ncbi:hypothetical protein NM952_12430 [Pasteurella multocida subsp. multocida]|uniref:Uncharacterized protein n=1 Tax=Pasteurella multocida TaxID=747 RepID=A0A9X3UW43_PASMD|nr:hypothetical protein [Pasteurella multocida]AKD37789.1 hypothetical protein I926_02295 [Pasteurella multocida subsp. multocida OH4807]MBF6981701.1 hypothetical protein [Pasteurella multocida]MBF6986115.1 hypothetical protein [Pasteurella multocida]MDA5609401.1 hypothetical protein [Pasteurella multocida subsp. multocida]MDA5611856.1 hypothetical protein [Pasteurella multocida]